MITRIAEDRVPKIAVGRADLVNIIAALDQHASGTLFKQLRAWWCLSC